MAQQRRRTQPLTALEFVGVFGSLKVFHQFQNWFVIRVSGEWILTLKMKKTRQHHLDRYTRFVSAAVEGNQKRMKRMLFRGFDVNTANAAGETAFSWCCQYNKLRSAQFLYQHGAEVNVELIPEPNPHASSSPIEPSHPLDVAVCWSSYGFRKWLKLVGGKRKKNFDEWPWPPTRKLKWKS